MTERLFEDAPPCPNCGHNLDDHVIEVTDGEVLQARRKKTRLMRGTMTCPECPCAYGLVLKADPFPPTAG